MGNEVEEEGAKGEGVLIDSCVVSCGFVDEAVDAEGVDGAGVEEPEGDTGSLDDRDKDDTFFEIALENLSIPPMAPFFSVSVFFGLVSSAGWSLSSLNLTVFFVSVFAFFAELFDFDFEISFSSSASPPSSSSITSSIPLAFSAFSFSFSFFPLGLFTTLSLIDFKPAFTVVKLGRRALCLVPCCKVLEGEREHRK